LVDLIVALLQPNPAARPTADQVAAHPFYQAARDAAAEVKESVEALTVALEEARDVD
jgi:hypothetical protein